MDDLETHEERLVLPRTCFSVEPGIYPQIQVERGERLHRRDRGVHVTGELQREIVRIG